MTARPARGAFPYRSPPAYEIFADITVTNGVRSVRYVRREGFWPAPHCRWHLGEQVGNGSLPQGPDSDKANGPEMLRKQHPGPDQMETYRGGSEWL